MLRLALGVLWFVALPAGGYGSPAERGGYVMADAYVRDQASWKLSQSERPLWKAITTASGYHKADQYGGLLYVSALLYRYLDGESHQPLQMVVVTASISSLTLLFAWAFARRVWGESVAKIASWGLALYPEAVLLGSTQMREAFLVTLITAAFYGLFRYSERRSWGNLAWILAPLLLSLLFSPPVAAVLVVFLVIQELVVENGKVFHQRALWLVLAVLVTLAIAGIWLAWRRLAPSGVSNPFALIVWWTKQAISLQARASRLDSGWTQHIFRTVPQWLHLTLMMLYGIVRPLLPAALVDISSAPIWRGIAIWRATGWTILLPFLIYAPFLAFRGFVSEKDRSVLIVRGLTIVVWLGIVAASLRGGADLWDNPRYRVMFAGLQLMLAAWVWATYRSTNDRWLSKTLVALGLVLIWFLPWYLRRYTGLEWPVVDFFKTLGLGVVSSALYFIWDWLKVIERA